jgi:hypothetical protein
MDLTISPGLKETSTWHVCLGFLKRGELAIEQIMKRAR